MIPVVVVVGGGYAGFAVAKALDEVADVVLVERKQAFFHNVAALRAVVDPEWASRIFLPYDRLLANGRVVQGQAISVTPGTVTLRSGESVSADYLVLATGSSYPFPAKSHEDDTHRARMRYAEVQAAAAVADRIVLLGAGPVGLELAGEITWAWPEKQVWIIDQADGILSGGYSDELRRALRDQLEARGVRFVLRSMLVAEPATRPGEAGEFTVTTASGAEITADMWLRCFGSTPVTDYLDGELATARTGDARVRVNEQLRVAGFDTVFAVGDITDVDEPKMAGRAARHAEVVVQNITRLINGDQDLVTYQPSPPVILVPLGPEGGAAQLPGSPDIAGPEIASQYKGHDLFVGRYAEMFGLDT
jgi:apoptosis-inducing factor 2